MAKEPMINIIINGKRLANCTKVSDDIKWDNQEDTTFDGVKKSQAEHPNITIKCSDILDRNTQYNNIIKEAVEQAQTKDGLVITIENKRTGITKHYTGCVIDSVGSDDDPKKLNTSRDFQFSATEWEENGG